MTLKDIDVFCSDITKNSNILDVKVKNYSECGYCSDPENRIELDVSWETYSEWLYLSHQMGDREWAGVFTVKDGSVADFRIPKQEVSSVSVEFKEELGGNGIVHSHHGMGAFHSGQDDKHCRNLFDYSIVVSNSGYVATKRIELPCGAFGYLNVRLVITGIPPVVDLSKITEKPSSLFHEDRTSEHWTDLVPDEPETEVLSTADLPCDECTSHDCARCVFAAESREAWAEQF